MKITLDNLDVSPWTIFMAISKPKKELSNWFFSFMNSVKNRDVELSFWNVCRKQCWNLLFPNWQILNIVWKQIVFLNCQISLDIKQNVSFAMQNLLKNNLVWHYKHQSECALSSTILQWKLISTGHTPLVKFISIN